MEELVVEVFQKLVLQLQLQVQVLPQELAVFLPLVLV
jgi:hypothetical protein